MNPYCYDIEVYPNVFTCRIIHVPTVTCWSFEISKRKNQLNEFTAFIHRLSTNNADMVGFNNIGYDYPVIHSILTNQFTTTNDTIYRKSNSIIHGENRFEHLVWPKDEIVKQVDLYKIHHFDNKDRRTSLKDLEIVMQMDNVEELPFPPGTVLNNDQIDLLHKYNDHDVVATMLLFKRSEKLITFRDSLSSKYGKDFTNYNDSKIGEQIFIHGLEGKNIQCYTKVNGRRAPRQTFRDSVPLRDIVFPYVKFERPEFQTILDRINDKVLYQNTKGVLNTKGAFKDLHCTIDGIKYVFGVGGIHGAHEQGESYYSSDEYSIEMRDVVSYYPSMSIKNRLFPEHLGDKFCDVYEDIFTQRRSFKKGTNENKALKLALNGTYGNTNNKYSPFYDPRMTMTITLNGQLLLCMLVEKLIKIPNLKIINVNTDGVGFIYPRCHRGSVDLICQWWETLTQLELETDEYKEFHQRDVNNYIAVDSSVKLKGAYVIELELHKDPSSVVVAKAAKAYLVDGISPEQFILSHKDLYDFMLRAKVPRSNQLVMNWEGMGNIGINYPLPRITRYFVSRSGGYLTKIAPPTGTPGTWKHGPGKKDLVVSPVQNPTHFDSEGTPHDPRIHTKNKSMHQTRFTSIDKGYVVTVCNDITCFDWDDVNYDYYIEKTNKLIDPIR